MHDQAAIEVATLRALQESAGADFVAELATAYLDDAPAMIATMREALAARDEAAFRRAAHTLKSNSLTFGANALGGMARDLETNAREHVERGDAAPLDALSSEQQRVAAALRELAGA
jgi:HPt (histidine-containing phosphotransfer) domain-containing protein